MPASNKRPVKLACSGCGKLTLAEPYSERLRERLCLPCMSEWEELDRRANAELYRKRDERNARRRSRDGRG